MAKKIVLVVMMAIMLSGCGASNNNDTTANPAEATPKADAKEIDITEEMFINWVTEITNSPESYLGDIVHLEGLYIKEGHETILNNYSYVYRRGFGCCGTDGGVFGFEYIFDGEEPNDGDWIEVTGVITQYDNDGTPTIVINADSVVVKDEYGSVFVEQ